MADPGTIRIEIKRSHLSLVLALAALAAMAAALDSETLTLTTSYPAPSGVYNTMVTTGQTTLARDLAGATVTVGPLAAPGPGTTIDRVGNITARASISAGGNVSANGTIPGGGNMTAAGNVTAGGQVTAGGSMKTAIRLGTNNFNPDAGYPTGWGGGVHAWDVYAEGTVGVGAGGSLTAYMTRSGQAQAWDVWLTRVGRWASQGALTSCGVYSYGSGGNPATFYCPAGQFLLSGGCDNSGCPVYGFHPVGTNGWYCYSPCPPQTVTLLCCS